MATYKIPLTWESYTRIEVEADNLQEALEKAYVQFMNTPVHPDESYIGDSVQLDEYVYEEYPEEAADFIQAMRDVHEGISPHKINGQ